LIFSPGCLRVVPDGGLDDLFAVRAAAGLEVEDVFLDGVLVVVIFLVLCFV
jgi:hypothetical protein